MDKETRDILRQCGLPVPIVDIIEEYYIDLYRKKHMDRFRYFLDTRIHIHSLEKDMRETGKTLDEHTRHIDILEARHRKVVALNTYEYSSDSEDYW